MHTYLAAALQLNSTPNIEDNLQQAAGLISEAVIQGAQLIALPENFSFLGSEEEKQRRAVEISRYSETFLKEKAQYFNVFLVGGGHPVVSPGGKLFNRAVIVDPSGDVRAYYDKIHLFDVDLPNQSFRESDTVEAGREPVHTQDNTLGCVGLTICYDIRFPELYRLLADRGADVILVPAAFTEFTGRDHWQVLLRARAIENTCYLVAPAQCGRHYGERRSYGHASIIDPWGQVLASCGSEPGLAIAELSPGRIADVRSAIPSLQHRKLGIAT